MLSSGRFELGDGDCSQTSGDGCRQPPAFDERRGGRGGSAHQTTPVDSTAGRTSGRVPSSHQFLPGLPSAWSSACESTQITSPLMKIKWYKRIFKAMLTVCAAVFPGLCMSEAGQLLLLLLASFLPEQQLRLEGGWGRPPVCVVWCRRNPRWVAARFLHFRTAKYMAPCANFCWRYKRKTIKVLIFHDLYLQVWLSWKLF